MGRKPGEGEFRGGRKEKNQEEKAEKINISLSKKHLEKMKLIHPKPSKAVQMAVERWETPSVPL